jgi:hypothetical protein
MRSRKDIHLQDANELKIIPAKLHLIIEITFSFHPDFCGFYFYSQRFISSVVLVLNRIILTLDAVL